MVKSASCQSSRPRVPGRRVSVTVLPARSGRVKCRPQYARSGKIRGRERRVRRGASSGGGVVLQVDSVGYLQARSSVESKAKSLTACAKALRSGILPEP